jgi:hypothetical protein
MQGKHKANIKLSWGLNHFNMKFMKAHKSRKFSGLCSMGMAGIAASSHVYYDADEVAFTRSTHA